MPVEPEPEPEPAKDPPLTEDDLTLIAAANKSGRVKIDETFLRGLKKTPAFFSGWAAGLRKKYPEMFTPDEDD